MKKDIYYTFEGIREQEHVAPYLWSRELFYVNVAYIPLKEAIQLAREHFEPKYLLWWYQRGWWTYGYTSPNNVSIQRFNNLYKVHD